MRDDTLTASMLINKSTAAAAATPGNPHAIPLPEVAAGGTCELAIATPIKVDPALWMILIASARPDPRARKRERKLGLVSQLPGKFHEYGVQEAKVSII
jgi:hypothetical protein